MIPVHGVSTNLVFTTISGMLKSDLVSVTDPLEPFEGFDRVFSLGLVTTGRDDTYSVFL